MIECPRNKVILTEHCDGLYKDFPLKDVELLDQRTYRSILETIFETQEEDSNTYSVIPMKQPVDNRFDYATYPVASRIREHSLVDLKPLKDYLKEKVEVGQYLLLKDDPQEAEGIQYVHYFTLHGLFEDGVPLMFIEQRYVGLPQKVITLTRTAPNRVAINNSQVVSRMEICEVTRDAAGNKGGYFDELIDILAEMIVVLHADPKRFRGIFGTDASAKALWLFDDVSWKELVTYTTWYG